MIRPCYESKELINESKVLNHCVRTYAKKIANGESLIMFVRKHDEIDTPFVTVELQKRGKSKNYNYVEQVRAKDNKAPDNFTTNFIHKWMKKNKLKGWAYSY